MDVLTQRVCCLCFQDCVSNLKYFFVQFEKDRTILTSLKFRTHTNFEKDSLLINYENKIYEARDVQAFYFERNKMKGNLMYF